MLKKIRFKSVLFLLGLACCLPVAPPQASAQTADRSLGDIAREIRAKQHSEVQVSAEDAKDIFAAVDEILDFASKDTGFPKRNPVKRQLVGRAQVDAFVAEEISKQSKTVFGRSELVLKKFGLLPADFKLKNYLLEATGRSLAGYYDFRDKTMYLMNWIPPEAQRPVMAHELTHALQDQNHDLAKFEKHESGAANASAEASMSVSGTDDDEHGIARTAVIEGQAMVVMADYILHPRGISLVDSSLGDAYANGYSDVLEGHDLPIQVHLAPRVLKESVLFPYVEGFAFEVELLRRGGKAMAFAGPFARMPMNAYQILHPDAYLKNTPTPKVSIPDLRPILGKEYEPFDSGMVGALDARIMAREFGRENDLFTVAANWDGGGYVAVRRIGVPMEKLTTADIALLYVSRWKNAKAAKRFVDIYKTALARRLTVTGERTQDNTECFDGEVCKTPVWLSKLITNEGVDYLEILPHNTVMIAQGFDEAAVAQLRQLILTPAAGQLNTANMHELSLSLYESPAFRAFQEQVLEDVRQDVLAVISDWSKSRPDR